MCQFQQHGVGIYYSLTKTVPVKEKFTDIVVGLFIIDEGLISLHVQSPKIVLLNIGTIITTNHLNFGVRTDIQQNLIGSQYILHNQKVRFWVCIGYLTSLYLMN